MSGESVRGLGLLCWGNLDPWQFCFFKSWLEKHRTVKFMLKSVFDALSDTNQVPCTCCRGKVSAPDQKQENMFVVIKYKLYIIMILKYRIFSLKHFLVWSLLFVTNVLIWCNSFGLFEFTIRRWSSFKAVQSKIPPCVCKRLFIYYVFILFIIKVFIGF